MIISLAGYMGSGKSHISKILSKKINFKLIDLDKEISLAENLPITEIFLNKGEIHFRKREREILLTILHSKENIVLSLGGGTPVYYDNIKIINENSISFYLRANVSTLTERLLKHKNKRPLIAKLNNEDLPEFIAKHLFERSNYYNQCQHIIATDNKSAEEVMDEIVNILPNL